MNGWMNDVNLSSIFINIQITDKNDYRKSNI